MFKIFVVAAVLFLGMLVFAEIGFRLGRVAVARFGDRAHEGLLEVETAVFALFGLGLAFSYGGASTRLAERRDQIVNEANAIETAYQRLNVLPPGDQPYMRQLFRQYLEARISMSQKLPDIHAADREYARAEQIQQEMWQRASAASGTDLTQRTAMLVLPALNEMTDWTTTRKIAIHTTMPLVILVGGIGLGYLTAVLAGYSMAKQANRNWLHLFIYAFSVAVIMYVIIDLDHPRGGLITLDEADKTLIELRNSIK